MAASVILKVVRLKAAHYLNNYINKLTGRSEDIMYLTKRRQSFRVRHETGRYDS